DTRALRASVAGGDQPGGGRSFLRDDRDGLAGAASVGSPRGLDEPFVRGCVARCRALRRWIPSPRPRRRTSWARASALASARAWRDVRGAPLRPTRNAGVARAGAPRVA